MKLLRIIFLFVALPAFGQQGGMWVPSLLEGTNEAEMKNLGMKMSAKDIYDLNQPSLKDAIVHFNGGCTSEFISPNGLLLTNHHCGYAQIQSHSSVAHDYLQDGFWAKDLKAELPNPGVTATIVISIEDVTENVLKGIDNQTPQAERQKLIEANIAQINKTHPREKWQDVRIRPFYEGNQYMLFVVETFKDVRLVGAPPSSIGKFGSDTDNWVWPRHTGDFGLFRVYADADNRPADYAETNVPYKPRRFLPISLDGVVEGDFTLVFGFPGTTDEYLPAVAIEQIVEHLNPARIAIRNKALTVMDRYMRADQQIKIQYASKYASIANFWKKWTGESIGLKKSGAIAIKRQQEEALAKQIEATGKNQEYGHLLPDFEKYYTQIQPYAVARDYFQETALRNVELLRNAFQTYQLVNLYKTRGAQSFQDRKENLIKTLEGAYRNYSKQVDREVFETLIAHYAENVPAEFLPESLQKPDVGKLTEDVYRHSAFANFDSLRKLFSGDAADVVQRIESDPGYQVALSMADAYFDKVAPRYDALQLNITGLVRDYMRALKELSPADARIFPNANSTLRVTYGQVKGYAPGDAVYYGPVTHLEGVMEKYIPGDYEFDVPEKLRTLYETRDFGPYAENGKMPVNFIGTNHTTGGNSGSPALDAYGNLIGLNFDRVWEGTMSDYYYDPSISRNIMVDIRYVLFIIDKYAGAGHLIDEMTLVHPKKEQQKQGRKKKKKK